MNNLWAWVGELIYKIIIMIDDFRKKEVRNTCSSFQNVLMANGVLVALATVSVATSLCVILWTASVSVCLGHRELTAPTVRPLIQCLDIHLMKPTLYSIKSYF